jgi:hypothetical protein
MPQAIRGDRARVEPFFGDAGRKDDGFVSAPEAAIIAYANRHVIFVSEQHLR